MSRTWDVPVTRLLQKKFCFFFLTCLILSNTCDTTLLQWELTGLHEKEPKGAARWVREKEETSRAFVKHTASGCQGDHPYFKKWRWWSYDENCYLSLSDLCACVDFQFWFKEHSTNWVNQLFGRHFHNWTSRFIFLNFFFFLKKSLQPLKNIFVLKY